MMEVDEDVSNNSRWASQPDSDVFWCESGAAMLGAVAAGTTKIEVGSAEKGPLLDALAQVIGRLDSLSLVDCDLDGPDLAKLGDMISTSNAQLQAIGISNNTEVDSRDWAGFWAKMPKSIAKWDFGDNNLSDEALPFLVQAIQRGRGGGGADVEELCLDGNRFRNISPLLSVVANSRSLSELDLGDNEVGDEQVQALVGVLPTSSLRTLVLGRNPISDAGILPLVQALPRCSLSSLHLDSTLISDAAMFALADVLNQTQLEEIDIDSTQVKDAGIMRLCAAVPGSKLGTLEIGDAELRPETIHAMQTVLPDAGGGDGVMEE